MQSWEGDLGQDELSWEGEAFPGAPRLPAVPGDRRGERCGPGKAPER